MSRFYAESLGCPPELAARVDRFMRFAYEKGDIILSPKPWANYGKVRVYFDLWSQNSLIPIDRLKRIYFDADECEIYVDSIDVRPLSFYPTLRSKAIYSGARTREAILQLAEDFYREKATWS